MVLDNGKHTNHLNYLGVLFFMTTSAQELIFAECSLPPKLLCVKKANTELNKLGLCLSPDAYYLCNYEYAIYLLFLIPNSGCYIQEGKQIVFCERTWWVSAHYLLIDEMVFACHRLLESWYI